MAASGTFRCNGLNLLATFLGHGLAAVPLYAWLVRSIAATLACAGRLLHFSPRPRRFSFSVMQIDSYIYQCVPWAPRGVPSSGQRVRHFFAHERVLDALLADLFSSNQGAKRYSVDRRGRDRRSLTDHF